MNAAPGVSAASPRASGDVSLFRLYTLRACYLILSLGLGIYMWPAILRHSDGFAVAHGIQLALLGGLGATAILGIRYPVRMIPLLLFELTWKAVYLLAFALPLELHHQVTEAVAEDIFSVLMVVVLIPLIPWRHVFSHFILDRGDRWS